MPDYKEARIEERTYCNFCIFKISISTFYIDHFYQNFCYIMSKSLLYHVAESVNNM